MSAWACAHDLAGRGICGPRRVHLTAVEPGWHDAKTMYPGSIPCSRIDFRSMVRKCVSVRATVAGRLACIPSGFSTSSFLFLILLQFHKRDDDVSVDAQLAVRSQLPGAAEGNLAAAAVARCSTRSGFAVAMLLWVAALTGLPSLPATVQYTCVACIQFNQVMHTYSHRLEIRLR